MIVHRRLTTVIALLLCAAIFVGAAEFLVLAQMSAHPGAGHGEVLAQEQQGDDADGTHEDGHHGPVNDKHRGEHLPDSFSHLSFVPTPRLPEVAAPVEFNFIYPNYVASLTEGEIAPPGHVPKG